MKKLILTLTTALILTVAIALFCNTSDAATYNLVMAKYNVLVNGQNTGIQAYNLNGTTLLPVRQVSEAVGVPIKWTGQVEINTVDVDKLKEACVMIYASDGETYEQGSGVYIDYDQVLTAYHTVDDGRTQVRTTIEKSDQIMTVVSSSPAIDIALLKSYAERKPVKIGDSDEVNVGDQVIVIGAPEGKEDTVTYTTVKALASEIVINASLNGGGSGSAVFDMQGNLIGIVVARDNGLNETYLIPINDIREQL